MTKRQTLKNCSIKTIHQRNIQALAIEVYKTLIPLNPVFMKEIFCLKKHIYSTRRQQLITDNPSAVTYAVESFRYKESQIWISFPSNVQVSHTTIIKDHIKNHAKKICKSNLCKLYNTKLRLG